MRPYIVLVAVRSLGNRVNPMHDFHAALMLDFRDAPSVFVQHGLILRGEKQIALVVVYFAVHVSSPIAR